MHESWKIDFPPLKQAEAEEVTNEYASSTGRKGDA
jgi:hypothetical protein